MFDVDSHATDKLIRNLSVWPALRVIRAASTADAVRGADIVTTVTADKACATILTRDMIEPGMHLNAVGGDCPGKTELHADVLRMGRVFVEYELQTRIEGDIQQMPADFPVAEFWRVLLTIPATTARPTPSFPTTGSRRIPVAMSRCIRGTATTAGARGGPMSSKCSRRNIGCRTHPVALERFCTHFNFEPMCVERDHRASRFRETPMNVLAASRVAITLKPTSAKSVATLIITSARRESASNRPSRPVSPSALPATLRI